MITIDTRSFYPIGTKLLEKEESISVAESVTAGLLQFSLSTIPDAARFFQGGLTAYNVAQKYRHLGVEPIHAIATNCVSLKVAKEMAVHVCEEFASNWGLGITGYASQVAESEGKLFAFFAIAYNGKIKTAGKITPTEKDPPSVQEEYCRRLLSKLKSIVAKGD